MSAWTRHIQGRDSSISVHVAHVTKDHNRNTNGKHRHGTFKKQGFPGSRATSVLPQELLPRSANLLQQLTPTQLTLYMAYIINEDYFYTFLHFIHN